MDATQFLFDAVSQLTGGLITDMRTLMLGGLVLTFILMGLDYLKSGFDEIMNRRAHDRYLEDAEDLRMEREQYRRGSAEWEEANYMYRHFIGKAAKSRLRSWGK